MGPTNHLGEVLNPTAENPDKVVPGLFAAGEAACASVHGANRLGANSLLDIVVFGRACANRVSEVLTPGKPHKEVPATIGEESLARLNKLRYSKGPQSTAELRLKMQKVMQNDAAVFRTQETLAEGVTKIDKVWDEFAADVGITDRSMVWNSDLIETLELQNLLENAVIT